MANFELDKNNIPTHVAIIMDGNGRWAKAQGMERSMGHAKGTEMARRITEEATRLGVKYLTLYTFSTENWNRPPAEIAAIFTLLLDNLEEEVFIKNKVRLRVIGDLGRLPEEVQRRIQACMDHTADYDRTTMVVALSYSSRWELTEATKQIARQVKEGKIKEEDITDEYISSQLQTNFMPDPDLLIRTGGEKRISNYLLWQCAYSEFIFTDTYWPDFDEACFRDAIAEYQQRQRRFGKTGDQVEAEKK